MRRSRGIHSLPVIVLLSIAACHGESRKPEVSATAPPSRSRYPEPPVSVRSVSPAERIDVDGCPPYLVLAVTDRTLSAFGETLGAGDVVVVRNPRSFDVTGAGYGVVAAPRAKPCPSPTAPTVERVIRGTSAEEVVWAGGAMRAHLDVETADFSLGRIEGTAAVVAHEHPTSWEFVVGVGRPVTFEIALVEKRLRPGEIFGIRPGVPHGWLPDPGSKMQAIQIFAPPGPEQELVARSKAEDDAGPR